MLATHARPLLPALALLLSCSSGSKGSNTESPATPAQKDVTIFLSAEIKGTTEPCGCTSDPLGDLARTAELIVEAKRKGPVIVLDGGSTLYSAVTLGDKNRAQEQLKSTLLERALVDTIKIDALALGPFDLAEGPGKVRPARQAANLSAESGVALEAPKIIESGEIKIGVFGVLSQAAFEGTGLQVAAPGPVAVKTVADLRARGAEVVIALAHMTKTEARELSKAAPGIDFVLISQNLPEPDKVRGEAVQVGDSWLVEPANRGQVLSRVQLSVRGPGHFSDAIGQQRAQVLIGQLRTMQDELGGWKADPSADPSFLAEKERELDEFSATVKRLEASPVLVPSEGNYFTLEQVRIAKGLSCDKDIVAAKRAYDKAAGEANVKAGAGIEPVPPAKGQAGYVGMEECESCHKEAVEFWRGTKHAHAWKTLELAGKEFNFECIGCHVTGFDKPGGSNIAFNESLRDVQCEQCHGAGSIHVDADGPLRKSSITRVPDKSVCTGCHTPEHSDTFDFDAYVRDVTGKGHGEARRTALGEGDTGHALRAAALEKAGAAIGANCPK